MGKTKDKLNAEHTNQYKNCKYQDLLNFLKRDRGINLIFNKCSITKALSDIATKKFIAINRAWEEYIGYKMDEVIGFTTNHLKLVGVEDGHFIRESLDKNNSLKSLEAEFIKKIPKVLLPFFLWKK